MKKLAAVVLIALLAGIWLGRTVHAQSTAPWQVAVSSATHTSCTVTASTTQFCFASDGLWVSLNGAAYTQIGGAAGVISWNGQTGAVVYTPPAPPVISVNGKTGAVVISATTTAATTAATTLQ
jgi:hypothetical protein